MISIFKIMHKSVLLNEVIEYLNPNPGEIFYDGTANGGGHSLAIWERVKPNGKVLAIDKDESAMKRLKDEVQKIGANFIFFTGSYENIDEYLKKAKIDKVDGILLDLGYSSYQIEEGKRGFSFLRDELLIMRYETNLDFGNELTAYHVVNSFPKPRIIEILKEYGEERQAEKIAEAIVRQRKIKKIETSKELAEIIENAVKRKGKIHPATKTFQAIRIFVNQELEELKNALKKFPKFLKQGGRLAVISFHSLEDRIVKRFLKEHKDDFQILTKKPVIPTKKEVLENKRSRSAKLRVAIKL